MYLRENAAGVTRGETSFGWHRYSSFILIKFCVIVRRINKWAFKRFIGKFLEGYVSGIFLYSGIFDATVN